MLAKSEWKPEEESLSYEPITDIISTPNREQKWVHVTLSDGKVITATEGHPFRTVEGWRDAVLLKQGDILILTGSDGKPSTIQVDGIRYDTKVLTTYNLEVANAHTFFVGEDAVLVHNSACELPTVKPNSKAWDEAVEKLQNLGKEKLNLRTETASDAKKLLEEGRGKMDNRNNYTNDTYKKGYEVHNSQNQRELDAGNDLQHLKWKDGKSGGHIYYNKPN